MTIKITTPLMCLQDKDRNPLKKVALCASDFEVAEKLSKLPPGQYWLERPPVKIIIK